MLSSSLAPDAAHRSRDGRGPGHADPARLFPDRRVWLTLAAAAATASLWFLGGGASLTRSSALELLVAVGILAFLHCIVGMLRAAFGHVRLLPTLHFMIASYAFIIVAFHVLSVLNSAVMATALPYVDQELAWLDAALGLDWLAYHHAVMDSPLVSRFLGIVYDGLDLFAFSSFLLFCARRDFARARFLLEAFWLAALSCIVIGMLTPAEGTTAFHLRDTVAPDVFATLPGTSYLEHLDRVRTLSPIVLDLGDMPGLTTFPSFHTAGAMIVALAFRGTRLFLPALVCAGLIVAATPVFGGHYFVDLLGGAVVALATARLLAALACYRGVLATRRAGPSAERASADKGAADTVELRS